jgi:hypothetical protein
MDERAAVARVTEGLGPMSRRAARTPGSGCVQATSASLTVIEVWIEARPPNTWARWARATTSSKCASTKPSASGSCCTAALAASATGSVFVTRKGAVRAGAGDLGIIPGSMGARSFIVKGKGNPESFHSCSHGAGRVMSRTQAKKQYTVEDHIAATEGVECRKDAGVIDETPMAYKDIDAVMAAQSDLVDIVHTLKQVVCVKG